MKLNLGCGHRKQADFVNVDLFAECDPDQVFDLEKLPWPWPENSADKVLFNHSLEHLGQTTSVFLGIMKELYRVCCDGAIVEINVPHPRHDFYLGDPTHVRPITPEVMSLFDSRLNDEWRDTQSSAATPLGHYLGVDFTIVNVTMVLDEPYASMLTRGEMTEAEVVERARERNNVVREIQIKLKARK